MAALMYLRTGPNLRSEMIMKRIVPGLLVVFLVTCSSYAQSTTSLRGVITDSSGGVIPEAAVTMTSTENGAVRTSVTEANGVYNFPQVVPGTNKLTPTKTGFAKMPRNNITFLLIPPATPTLSMYIATTDRM